jgi:hypothetical protein
VAVVAYMYANMPVIPLLKLFSSATDIAQARILASRGFLGIGYIKNIFGLTFVPMASCIIYATYLRHKNRRFKRLFWMSFVLSGLALLYDLSKAPVLLYVFSLLMVQNDASGTRRKVGLKPILFVLFGAGAIACMYIWIMGVEAVDLLDLWNPQSAAFRIVLGQVQALLLHFEAFPRIIPFQWGASIAGFLRSTPGELPARLVMEVFNPWGVSDGTAGVMNAYYISEAWANFGYAGVILSPVLVGLLWHVIFRSVQSKRTPVRSGLFGFLSVQMANITIASVSRLIYNPEVAISLSTVGLCILIGRVLARNAERNEIPNAPSVWHG